MGGDMDAALAEWMSYVGDRIDFHDIAIDGVPRISQTDKWRYWRCNLADGSKLSVNIQTKPAGEKSTLSINHDKLSDADGVELWRSYWKSFVAAKGEL